MENKQKNRCNWDDNACLKLVGEIIKKTLLDFYRGYGSNPDVYKNEALQFFRHSNLFKATGLDYIFLMNKYVKECNIHLYRVTAKKGHIKYHYFFNLSRFAKLEAEELNKLGYIVSIDDLGISSGVYTKNKKVINLVDDADMEKRYSTSDDSSNELLLRMINRSNNQLVSSL